MIGDNNLVPVPPFSPIIFINNIEYVEIMPWKINNIRPGQYINEDGIIWDKYINRFRHPVYGCNKYARINLYLLDGSILRTNMHRVKMLAFRYIPGCEDHDQFVNHKNGNKLDNDFDNLEWSDPVSNARHAIEMGLTPIGENSPKAKLSENEVKEILFELANSNGKYGTITYLAKKYNVSDSAIIDIKNGESWKKVSKELNLDIPEKFSDSIISKEDVKKIREEISLNRYRGQYKDIASKYNVSPSTIKEIVYNRSAYDPNYTIPKNLNNILPVEYIHEICKIIQNYGTYNDDVYNEILTRLNLINSKQLRHNIRRLYRRDKGCYYNITSLYKWN